MSKTYFSARDIQYGMKPKLGSEDKFYKTLYTSMYKVKCSGSYQNDGEPYGGIFNLEFSPDSSLLIAACEKKSIVLWDPVTLRQIQVIDDAHSDCVNGIKFINHYTFATCSDDTTIALWDIRNMKKKIQSLNGHSNWVKNIEYDATKNLLISSAFDGSIYSWALNTYTENNQHYKRIFHTSGLMRCRLSPDSSKLVLCTTGGFIMVIHDLNLDKLAQDLDGFKPNIFRLMQMGRQHIPVAAYYKYLFCKSRTRNRVELISDFPKGNDAEVISSLQIHPHGWCTVSRNISYDESSEWTCVHDIQELKDDKQTSDSKSTKTEDLTSEQLSMLNNINGELNAAPPGQPDNSHSSDLWEAVLTIHDQRTRRINNANRNTNPQHQFMHYIARISSGLNTFRHIENDIIEDISAPSTSNSIVENHPEQNISNRNRGKNLSGPPCDNSCYDNTPRLLRYILEAITHKGFIKESCFSPEGRIIGSPFGFGVRLLAFNEDCHELSVLDNKKPLELSSICHNNCHKNIVVSTKFSPRLFILVSGCLNGQIASHNPIL